jgi:ribonuclease HI
VSRYIGRRTNNQAEYQALLCGLDQARDWPNSDIVVQTDSELVFRQLEGGYKVKNEQLRPLHSRASAALAGLVNVRLRHVPREENGRADKLAKAAAESGRED